MKPTGNLNSNQQSAVESTDKRLLVLAGAGSGKTKTLLQKIIYLIEEKGVSPNEILAITFTKNATNEMIDRLIISADKTGEYEQLLQDKHIRRQQRDMMRLYHQRKYKWVDGLTVKTFHGFCYGVLRNFGVNEFDNKFRVISDEKRDEEKDLLNRVAPETVFEVFHKLLILQCDDPIYLLRLKRHILDYFVDRIHIEKHYENRAAKFSKPYRTLNGTLVRSKSEQFIADWFYRHSIRFEYEPKLNIRDFTFRPDFYLPDANLYLEHVSGKSYNMRHKEEQFKKGNILFVKTFDGMTNDSALINHTLEKILKNRLPAGYLRSNPLNFTEEFNTFHKEVKDFVAQVMRITNMVKVENQPLEKVELRAAKDQHERIREFYALAMPVIEKYLAYCTDKSYLDFNDLISRTISLFKNYKDIAKKFKTRYRYILVDEFQDVNNLQVELIKLMLTPETQLFCVGDDWQSIYGFRGSNVNYIIDFEKHFKDARTITLDLNYRSTQNIVGASNEVISHNKFKVDKALKASQKSEHKIVVFSGNDEEENLRFCHERVSELLESGISVEDILILYRRKKMAEPFFQRLRDDNIRVQFKTIHAAKGLEARVVFILGLTEGYGGFPDIWMEDRIFQVIKKANHDLLLEEERRLFYVAITRAKEKLFLITEKGNESSFLREIPEIFTVRTTVPLKAIVEEAILCKKCFSRLEKLWVVCPYCGERMLK
jgi:DNA helicase IV